MKTGTSLIKKDFDLAVAVLKNSKCFRVFRENGITSKFYSFNHKIIRLDFSKRCSVLENIVVI